MKTFYQTLCAVAFLVMFQTASYSQASFNTEHIQQFTSEAEAKRIISRITNAVGLKPNFQIKAGDVDNAAALVYRGKRYIIYNPVFIRQISAATNTDWGGISILAHEVGHHLNGHTLTGKGSVPSLELEADEFSGYVLRKMGASLVEAQAAMRVLASAKDSSTHPARAKRIASIEQGWRNAQEQIVSAAKNFPASPGQPLQHKRKPAAPKQQSTERVVASYHFPRQFIAGNVIFYSMPDKQFYLTVQSNFIQVDDQGYQVLGKLIRNGDSVMIRLSANEFLTVTSKGFILNEARQKIGIIRSRRLMNS